MVDSDLDSAVFTHGGFFIRKRFSMYQECFSVLVAVKLSVISCLCFWVSCLRCWGLFYLKHYFVAKVVAIVLSLCALYSRSVERRGCLSTIVYREASRAGGSAFSLISIQVFFFPAMCSREYVCRSPLKLLIMILCGETM